MAALTPRPLISITGGSGINLEPILSKRFASWTFSESPVLASSTVPGHEGRFIHGEAAGIPVILQQGRLHFYEGHGYTAVTRPVDLLRDWGVHTLLFTNAAGGLAPSTPAGGLMPVRSARTWPFRHWAGRPERLKLALTLETGTPPGCYWWVPGPTYETPAETRALQCMGGDAVGMSTAPELQRCEELGLRAAAIAVITNACGAPGPLSHEHVVEQARKQSERLRQILKEHLPRLARG